MDDLCSIYNVSGKLSVYKTEYNNLSILNNTELLIELMEYNKQDAEALYNALIKAQEVFYFFYKVDIVTIVSTSSLALKIFRTKYLDKDIIVPSPFG